MQPGGRGWLHASSHIWHSLPAFCSSPPSAVVTAWHSIAQVWFPHDKCRPQSLLQENGLAAWQGKGLISCFPRQAVGIGTIQDGQGIVVRMKAGSERRSQGPVGWQGFFCLTSTSSWHGSGQRWAHVVCTFWQDCLHGGQGPKWHRCFSLLGWWHVDGFLHCSLHLGGLVVRSLPQGTIITVALQLHLTSTVSGQG